MAASRVLRLVTRVNEWSDASFARRLFIASAALIGVSAALAFWAPSPPGARPSADVSFRVPEPQPFRTCAGFVLRRNTAALLVVTVGVFTGGAMSVLQLANIGRSLGLAVRFGADRNAPASFVATGLLPHAVLEVTAFSLGFVAVGFGLRASIAVWRGRIELAVNSARRAALALTVASLVLVLAGVVECGVTPALLRRLHGVWR
jgi:uncharacterized membrane protein SpoIIM required for sporulation